MRYHSLSAVRATASPDGNESLISRTILWRPVSYYVSWVFVNLGFRSVGVSSANILIIGAACYLLFYNSQWMLLAAAVGILLYDLIDHVDGELARFEMKVLRRNNSRVGHYLDLFAHKVSIFALFGIGWSVASATGEIIYTLLGFITSFFLFGPALEPARDIILGAKRSDDTERAREALGALAVGQASDARVKPLMRLALAVNESVGFPGWLHLVSLVCVLDAFLSPARLGGEEYYYRALLLIALTPIYAIKFLFAFRWYVRVMMSVKHD